MGAREEYTDRSAARLLREHRLRGALKKSASFTAARRALQGGNTQGPWEKRLRGAHFSNYPMGFPGFKNASPSSGGLLLWKIYRAKPLPF